MGNCGHPRGAGGLRVIGLLSVGLFESHCFGGGEVGMDIGADVGNLIDLELFLHAKLIIEFALDFVIRLYMHNKVLNTMFTSCDI